MKTLRFPLALALAATSLLTACGDKDKKDQEVPAPKTAADQLVGKDWKLTARTVSPAIRLADGRVVTDVYAEMASYDKDDLWRFEKPSAFTHDEGPTKRSTSDPQTYTGTWSLENNDKLLKTTATGLGNSSYNVMEINDNTLKVSGEKTETDGNRYTYTFVFTKQ